VGIITILLRRCDRSLVLDHSGSGRGRAFRRFLLDRGVCTNGWLSVTKLIQFNTIGHWLSVSWRSILGVIVAERSGSLKGCHQLGHRQTPGVETHGLCPLGFGLPRLGTSIGGLVLSIQTLFPSDGW